MTLESLQIKINSVIALYSNGQIEEAIEGVEALIKDYPNEASLYNISGAFYQAIGQLNESVKTFEKAVTINPDYPEAYYNLGVTLQQLGQFDAAMKSYEQALAIKHAYPDAHNNLGNILLNLRQLDAALDHFELAVAFKPDYAEAHNNLGIVLMELGYDDVAIKSFEKAVAIKPDFALPHNNLGITFQKLGQMDTALESYKKSVAIKPDYAIAHHNLSALKIYKANDAQITQMQSLLSRNDLNLSDRMHLCFALAKVNEDLGEQDKLFEFLHEGNRLRKKELNYSIENDQKIHLVFKNLFSSTPFVFEKSSYEASTIRPVFIVGMPRSGTTLVEQIITSHHAVHGAGELYNLANSISPILEDHLNQNTNILLEKDFLTIRHQYLDSLSSFKVQENVITDKMPLNFRNIGFILSAFPEAKVIHLKRDARATCWSIYKHYFNTTESGWAYNLGDLAKFYSLYKELMDFWHQLFPGKIYDVCYEDLTTNQEEEIRKLLEYCELDWDEKCLSFHKNKRAVKTASSIQVREKMYQGSSEVWKKHEAYLKPLTKALSSY